MVDFGQRQPGDFDQVRVAFLEHVDTDRRLAVEATAGIHALLLELYIGDVGQTQTVRADHQVT